MSKLTVYSFFAISVSLAYAAWALPAVIEPNLRAHAIPGVVSTNPKPCTDAAFGETCVPSLLPSMFAEYLACSSKAETQPLGQPEAITCLNAYLAVKLSFVSGIEPENFREMPRERQIEINRRAFKIYRKWRDKNPSLVITAIVNP